MITKEKQKELEELIKPMLEWVRLNCPPDTLLILDVNGSQLVNKMHRVLNLEKEKK